MDSHLPLDFLCPGEWGEITDVTGDPGWVCRLAEMGLRVGGRLRMVRPGCPCLLEVEGCRLCLRGDELSRILVRPVEQASEGR